MKNEIKIHKTIYPFQIVEQNKEFIIAIGNQKMSAKVFNKLADARQYVESKPYELLINVCCFAMSINEKSNTQNTENYEKENTENA